MTSIQSIELGMQRKNWFPIVFSATCMLWHIYAHTKMINIHLNIHMCHKRLFEHIHTYTHIHIKALTHSIILNLKGKNEENLKSLIVNGLFDTYFDVS